jgi:hypothetical protein
LASTGGLNFTTGPAAGQVFPLLQTTLVLDPTSIKADTVANGFGGGARVVGGALLLSIAGFNDMDTSWTDASLDWARAGYWSTGGVWDYWEDLVRHRGVFVTGYQTPVGAMPTTGSATFTGVAQGSMFFPTTPGSGDTPCKCGEMSISGTASFTANFGTRSLDGSLSMTAPPSWVDENVPTKWNGVAFSATISGSSFSGNTRATNIPTSPNAMGPNASGTIEGQFFGPAAQEAGAVWTLFDGTKSAIGTLTGKRP